MRTDPIRPFGEPDVAHVAGLHERVFHTGGRTAAGGGDPRHDYFTRVFLESPSRDPSLPSLVYQDDEGRIVGFLGVVPRRMSLNGEPLKAAISSQLVVDPASRSALVAVQLAARFLEGSQDVSIADEASDVARRIWEGLGGTTALLHSMYWMRSLRPARCAASLLRSRRLAPLAAIVRGGSRIADALATRMPRRQFFQARAAVPTDDLCTETFLARLPEFTGGSLRVEYDDEMFEWLLDRARQRRSGGTLRKAVIRNDQTVRGWYLYHLGPGGLADVLQIAATPSSIDDVLDHLFDDAWRQGATAVTGRMEPRFLQAFSDECCFFHRRGRWMLVSSKRPELLRAFQNGTAFFSRLDGEWCLGCQPDGPLTWSLQ